MAHLVAGMMRDIGFNVELISAGPDGAPPVVLGCIGGRGDRVLPLYNHYDVKPVDRLDERVNLSFEPDVRDGKVYARGTADNKGSIVSRVCTLEALA